MSVTKILLAVNRHYRWYQSASRSISVVGFYGKQNLGDTTTFALEAVIESLIGLLVPPSPWSGRLVAASAKAVSILHPDGALVSVVGRPANMEARAMMPAEGFSGFSARAAEMIECCRLSQANEQVQDGLPLRATWDGQQLFLAGPGTLDQPSEKAPVLNFGMNPVVWDPQRRLSAGSRSFLQCAMIDEGFAGVAPGCDVLPRSVSVCGVLAAEVRGLLAEAYAAGRRAEGLHGTGAFAAGFRRLEAHPDFPAVAVGFGPGTTPAGDDWLAGCLVALDLRAGGPGKAAADLRSKIRSRLEQTTAAGQALLLGALAGAPPEYLVGLAEAAVGLVEAAPAAAVEAVTGQAQGLAGLRSAVASCLEHGATSGEDALAGFVYGLGVDDKLVASEFDNEP